MARVRKLSSQFFTQAADKLAPALLGKILVRNVHGAERRARIVETEAYLGPADLASHSSRGRTRRTEVMFGPPARAYVYFIYGMHWMFNVTCGREGEAHAVLLRAAEPLGDWSIRLTGPALLAKAFAVTGRDNRIEVAGDDLYFEADTYVPGGIYRLPRINVDYAGAWAHRPLRFVDAKSRVAPLLPGIRGINPVKVNQDGP